MKPASPVIAYLFTTFPKATETFLQREIIAMKAHGVHIAADRLGVFPDGFVPDPAAEHVTHGAGGAAAAWAADCA